MKHTHVIIPHPALSEKYGFTAREYTKEGGSTAPSTYVIPRFKIFMKAISDNKYIYEIDGREPIIILETTMELTPCCKNEIKGIVVNQLVH